METEKIITANWWLIEIAIGLGIAIILSFALRKLISLYRKKISTKQGFWKKRIHWILHLPLQVAIWGFGISYVVDVIADHFGFDSLTEYTTPLQGAFIIACIGWISLRWSKEAFVHLAEKSEKLGVATGTIYAINKLASVVIFILILMIILPLFHVSIAPLLAFGGIGAAGIAFAAKDIVANFFGGAMLHFTRNFQIGDAIVIPSQSDFRGIVLEIGWYITVIKDYYGRPVYFPNDMFTKTQVINETRRTHRRINETIPIGYDALPVVDQIVDELREVIGAHPSVDNTQSFSISLMAFGDEGLHIYIYLLVHKMGYIQFLKIKQEILLLAEKVIHKYGAEICFPTTNIRITQMPETNREHP